MYYTIYKIINLLSGKFYVGKHETKNLNDGYMGSGKLLKRAINKHGIENFSKEILHVFESEAEMNAKEKELVEIGPHTYNLCPGGQGGFGYINTTRDHYSHNQKIANSRNYRSLEYRQKLSKAVSEARADGRMVSSGFKGYKHSEETKQKIRLAKLKK